MYMMAALFGTLLLGALLAIGTNQPGPQTDWNVPGKTTGEGRKSLRD